MRIVAKDVGTGLCEARKPHWSYTAAEGLAGRTADDPFVGKFPAGFPMAVLPIGDPSVQVTGGRSRGESVVGANFRCSLATATVEGEAGISALFSVPARFIVGEPVITCWLPRRLFNERIEGVSGRGGGVSACTADKSGRRSPPLRDSFLRSADSLPVPERDSDLLIFPSCSSLTCLSGICPFCRMPAYAICKEFEDSLRCIGRGTSTAENDLERGLSEVEGKNGDEGAFGECLPYTVEGEAALQCCCGVPFEVDGETFCGLESSCGLPVGCPSKKLMGTGLRALAKSIVS